MTIIGVDLSFRCTGYIAATFDSTGKIDLLDGGVFQNPSQKTSRQVLYSAEDDILCAGYLFNYLSELCKRRPTLLAIEVPTGGAQGARALATMSMAKGVVGAIHAQYSPAVVWVQPSHTKKLVPKEVQDLYEGKNRTKLMVQHHIKSVWPDYAWDSLDAGSLEHVADAAGAILVASSSSLFRALLSKGSST